MSSERPSTRRHFLWEAGSGMSGIALAWLLAGGTASPLRAAAVDRSRGRAGAPHPAARARRIVHVFACGGVSHLDTFDWKPELKAREGEELTTKGKIDTFFGRPGRILPSRFEFRPRGRSGLPVSDLLPHLAKRADDMAFIYSMTAKSANHTPATFQMNSGFLMNGFPSLGSWLSYGLGTENEDLPAFVVLPDPRQLPAGGAINWTSGFLPAVHQGVALRATGDPIADLSTPETIGARRRQREMSLLDEANRRFLERHPDETALSARIRSYELAARMQASVPETIRFDAESPATRALYGLDEPVTEGFGRNCLLARRLLERGVRFVQLYHGGAFGQPRINWDGHEDIVDNHTRQAASLDRPLAGLLADLTDRGMLEDTLVLFTTEFGRTPITEGVGAKGRDHHPHCFTVWMSGGGAKAGFGYGRSDEVGYFPAESPVSVHDFHATVLHLLGIDHERLTFYHNGIERRITDVHGQVVEGLIA
jgi:hypothetical protein